MDVSMLEDDEVPATTPQRPKTAAVLGLLAGVALIFSFLSSYCLVNALVDAEVMSRWQPGHDPRFKLLLGQFTLLMLLFVGIGLFARWTSRRQMSRIDEMEKD